MRGADRNQSTMFSYISPEKRIPADHPLRAIKELADDALESLSREFSEMYSHTGRPSIPPEQLLRAQLLQILYSVRSERLLMEQLDYNLLFRWFVGLTADDAVWDATVFSKNRERLLDAEIAQSFLCAVMAIAQERKLLSDEHFTVDGTQIEAWAGHKSFRRKDEKKDGPRDPDNDGVDFRSEKRTNETHQSTTDPEALMYRKSSGVGARLSYLGHVLTENRHGLVVETRLTQATGTAERDAAAEMIEGRGGTLGADKAYDTRDFVLKLRVNQTTPHVAQNQSGRSSAIDGRTTRHPGYAISQRRRKKVEEIFGWMKTVGLLRKTRHRGVKRVGWMFTFTAAAYNLVRMRTLLAT
jgi:transposase